MRRREFIAGLGSTAAWPVVARAQQPALPVVGFVNAGSADGSEGYVAAFRKGLGETGYVVGQNVTVEYHYLQGQFDRLPALMADLVRRRVAVIATFGNTVASIAAKTATATVPLVFSVAETTLRDVQEAARVIGLQIQVLNATTIGEIDAAFASLAHDRADALFVAPDGFYFSHQMQIATFGGNQQDSCSLWKPWIC